VSTERVQAGVIGSLEPQLNSYVAFDEIECRQIVQRAGDLAVFGAEPLLLDRERPVEQRLGLGVLTLGEVEQGQVVERPGHLQLLSTGSFVEDRQCALIERLGEQEIPLAEIKRGQVVERPRLSLVVPSIGAPYAHPSTWCNMYRLFTSRMTKNKKVPSCEELSDCFQACSRNQSGTTP